MRIVEVKAIVVEVPAKARRLEIIQVPDRFRLRYTHRNLGSDQPETETYLRVRTDEGIDGICTGAPSPAVMEVLRAQVIGADPLRREELYQRLHHGTRWVYQTPGWFGNFDNCLWDIAGKVAGLPVCQLLGQVRDRIPAYLTGATVTVRLRHTLRCWMMRDSGGASRRSSSTTTRVRQRTSRSSANSVVPLGTTTS